MMTGIRAIRTEADYDWALSEIEPYFEDEPVPGTPEAERFDILAALIEVYEAKHWPIEAADPVETIRRTMELTGRTQADLGELFGSRSRASEVLNRRRPLTIGMVYKLSEAWRIPAETLIRPYHTETEQSQGRAPVKVDVTKRRASAGKAGTAFSGRAKAAASPRRKPKRLEEQV
jgi:HTH-type transcriptional regulator/antitoxin HigA